MRNVVGASQTDGLLGLRILRGFLLRIRDLSLCGDNEKMSSLRLAVSVVQQR